MLCLIIHVTGRVQGVFYRASAKEKAKEMGLCGFARNEPDGSVYIEVEGNQEDLEKFESWCRQGPTAAKVMSVIKKEGTVKDFKEFKIIR